MKIVNKIEKPTFDGEVLLCEDNKMNQEIICGQFAKVGLRTVVAENGAEGVEAFRSRAQSGEKPFDLVFMDILMPVMDGLAAGAEINKMNTGTPVIAMTANATPEDKATYAAHGMTDCVNKPFTSQALWRCLLKYLAPVNPGNAEKNTAAESDEKLKHILRRDFISENQNTYDKIISAIETGDIKLANRLAHNLKSNAGQLGKTGLQKAAGDVENLLRDETNSVTPAELNALKSELDAVLKEFAAFNAAKPAGDGAAPRNNIDIEGQRELINRLELLLKSGSPECLGLIDGLRALRGSGDLIAQIENYNFDAAMEILKQSKQNWM